MDEQQIRTRVTEMMPEIMADLERLVAIPSVAFPGYPPEPVHEMAGETLRLFEGVGFTNAKLMEVPTGYPPVYGEIPGPAGSPTVMLYGHYDVQPAPPEQGWTSDPWTPTYKDDRMFGRGAADDKGGLAIHIGTMKVFDGQPPCTVKLILEGMEETNSNLEAFVEANPDLFACDVFIVCDMGNLRAGEPTLTTTLRGDVACVVTLRTLQHPLHSGLFGGPAPDAMMAMAELLATLHDDEGNVTVEGVSRYDWDGLDFTEKDFRAAADLAEGVELTTGSGLVEHPAVVIAVRLCDRPGHDVDRRFVERPDPRGQGEALDADRSRVRSGEGAGRAGAPPRGPHPLGRPAHRRADEGGATVPVRDRRTRVRRGAGRARGRVRSSRR